MPLQATGSPRQPHRPRQIADRHFGVGVAADAAQLPSIAIGRPKMSISTRRTQLQPPGRRDLGPDAGSERSSAHRSWRIRELALRADGRLKYITSKLDTLAPA